MKFKLLYVLLLLIIVDTGCKKIAYTGPAAPVAPSGTFTGTFRYLHRHTDLVPFDTLQANITLKMLTNTNPFSYTVTGDTATVHAGSFGSFSLTSPYMVFTDKTFPTSGTPTKQHLNGAYLYYYDGNVFQMLAYSADTLGVQYDLKKTGN
ncbi:MAG TPA: hypothetical protein VFE54_04445 [Mucilaginibacter sp.]|nr:hypothetical protein [Mucilaginibacter sp.]